jgi:regulator of protease activity HflC (stomatin/prohibitin superfamily)
VSVIERYGKYVKTLPSGIHYLVPFVDRIAYSYLIRPHTIDIPAQLVTSKDNVSVLVEGLLHLQVVDPILASYEVETTLYDDLIQLAQTTMRSEFPKIILHDYFDERDTLDEKILVSYYASSSDYTIGSFILFMVR